MRGICLLVAVALLGSCAATQPQPIRSAKNEKLYQEMIGGKIAQPVIDCIPTYNANDMTVIDEQTVLFRVVNARVYQVHLTPGCNQLGLGPYALLTRLQGTTQLCRGEIAQVIDTMNRMTVGSCTVGDITPFFKPGY